MSAQPGGDELTLDELNDPIYMERELRTTYKLRVHMNFMKEVLDKNIEMFLSHIESLVDKE